MISIAQAFRVWKRLLAQRDYPFPPEAKWLCRWLLVGSLAWGLAFGFGVVVATEVATNGWAGFIDEISIAPARPSFFFTLDAVVAYFSGVGLGVITLAPVLYTLAVIRHWADVGIDRWINEGRRCRTCGMEGQRARVNRYDLTMRFRADRKEYDRIQRARRLGKRGHVVEGA